MPLNVPGSFRKELKDPKLEKLVGRLHTVGVPGVTNVLVPYS